MPTTKLRKPTKTLKKAMKQDITPKKKKSTSKVSDRASDRAGNSHLRISAHMHVIYLLLTRGLLDQTQVAEKLSLKRQTINYHAKRLEIVGLIEPIDPNGNPKFYKPTPLIPFVSGSATPIVSESAKKMERAVGKTPSLVRDRKSGKIKGWKSRRRVGHVRDYDTIISIGGKRIPMLRVHSIVYTCTILREPLKEVPWKPAKEGMRGMDQFVYRNKFLNKKSTLFNLKELEVTFVRQKTKDTDELIICMPEKYFLEYELDQGEAILKEYVWKARKWFQNKFKVWLGLALPYREMEIAREIFDPALRRWVQENGMAKIQTKRGRGIVDESKKGFPEREFTTIEQVQADLESGDRILDLEEQMRLMMEQQSQLGTTDNAKKFQERMEILMRKFQEKMEGSIKKVEEEQERTQNYVLKWAEHVQNHILKLAEKLKMEAKMQNEMLEVIQKIQKNVERDQTERIMIDREKHQDSNIDNT